MLYRTENPFFTTFSNFKHGYIKMFYWSSHMFHWSSHFFISWGPRTDKFRWVWYASVNWVSIGSDNGLSPIRRQAIILTNAGLLSIGPLGTNFSEIFIKIQIFSFTKMHLKISSAKQWPFCSEGDGLSRSIYHRQRILIKFTINENINQINNYRKYQ